jgi:hypothetical protein
MSGARRRRERRPARAHRARGWPEHVVTIADFAGAQEHGVTFSSSDAGRAVHALAEIGELIESGRFSLPVAQPSRLPRSRRRTASARTAVSAGSSCCWSADAAASDFALNIAASSRPTRPSVVTRPIEEPVSLDYIGSNQRARSASGAWYASATQYSRPDVIRPSSTSKNESA